jgi:hypothetical protein
MWQHLKILASDKIELTARVEAAEKSIAKPPLSGPFNVNSVTTRSR